MTDWVRRPYNPAWDEDAVMYLWLKSYCHSRAGLRAGAHVDATPAEIQFIAEHRPIVEWLLTNAKTEVLCDPERVEPSDLGPPVVWAFACTSEPDVVHYALAKRSAMRVGLSGDMLKELLGERLHSPCIYTFDQVELSARRCEMHGIQRPTAWRPDPTWLVVNIMRSP